MRCAYIYCNHRAWNVAAADNNKRHSHQFYMLLRRMDLIIFLIREWNAIIWFVLLQAARFCQRFLVACFFVVGPIATFTTHSGVHLYMYTALSLQIKVAAGWLLSPFELSLYGLNLFMYWTECIFQLPMGLFTQNIFFLRKLALLHLTVTDVVD